MSDKNEVLEKKRTNVVNLFINKEKSSLIDMHDYRQHLTFVNTKKLNSKNVGLQYGNQQENASSKEILKNKTRKVYFNPNFQKPPLPTNNPQETGLTTSSNRINSFQRGTISESTYSKLKHPQVMNSMLFKKEICVESNHPCADISKDNKTLFVSKKNCRVFINPNYNHTTKLPVGQSSDKGSSQNFNGVDETHNVQNVQANQRLINKVVLNTPSMTNALVSPKKHKEHRKVVCNNTSPLINKHTLKRVSVLQLESEKEAKLVKDTNMIFFNPKFKDRLDEMKGFCNNDQNEFHTKSSSAVSTNIPVRIRPAQGCQKSTPTEIETPTCNSMPLSSRSLKAINPMRQIITTKPIHSNQVVQNCTLTKKESLCNSVSILSKHLKTIPNKQNPIKPVVQRRRSFNSSLVAISATKLIRKRKSSEVIQPNLNSNVKEPLFVSKTKLVRPSPSKCLKSKCVEGVTGAKTIVKESLFMSKTKLIRPSTSKCLKNKIAERVKVKRVLPQAQLQWLTPQKISQLRRQSFTNSITNLVDVVPNCAFVKRIRSKNGKSLRLVREKDVSKTLKADSSNKNIVNINVAQNKNILFKEQSKKKVLSVVKKPSKTQYSKINVEQTKKKISLPDRQSKYVYKNKNVSPRQSQVKHLLSIKKRVISPSVLKNCSNIFEKYKFIRSRYKIVKKQTSKYSTTNQSLRNEFKDSNHYPLIQRKSKWKFRNTGSKPNVIRHKLSLVNIGGIFYRCSRTSLTKNKSSPSKVSQATQKSSRSLLLNIRGQKFQLENNGQTLRCLDSVPERKRIDIGGVTFVSSPSGSSLVRTNYHTARSIILQAKQKSLSQLTRKLRKNNEPCPFYHRLGRCIGKECGSCIRLHDPKYISVCKKFVQGQCTDQKCLLSHTLTCHNMPTCQHFLAGHCGRDECPYPHIKVSDNAPICLDFLRGFCALGDQCSKRHLRICPSFEKGMCPRGKYCPYPHPKSKSKPQLKGKFKHLQVKTVRNPELVSSSSIRYFEDVNLQKEKNMDHLNEDLEESGENVSDKEETVNILRNRPKLGRLPSFISLTLDDSCNRSLSEEIKL